jgi:hypothetical protein
MAFDGEPVRWHTPHRERKEGPHAAGEYPVNYLGFERRLRDGKTRITGAARCGT